MAFFSALSIYLSSAMVVGTASAQEFRPAVPVPSTPAATTATSSTTTAPAVAQSGTGQPGTAIGTGPGPGVPGAQPLGGTPGGSFTPGQGGPASPYGFQTGNSSSIVTGSAGPFTGQTQTGNNPSGLMGIVYGVLNFIGIIWALNGIKHWFGFGNGASKAATTAPAPVAVAAPMDSSAWPAGASSNVPVATGANTSLTAATASGQPGTPVFSAASNTTPSHYAGSIPGVRYTPATVSAAAGSVGLPASIRPGEAVIQP